MPSSSSRYAAPVTRDTGNLCGEVWTEGRARERRWGTFNWPAQRDQRRTKHGAPGGVWQHSPSAVAGVRRLTCHVANEEPCWGSKQQQDSSITPSRQQHQSASRGSRLSQLRVMGSNVLSQYNSMWVPLPAIPKETPRVPWLKASKNWAGSLASSTVPFMVEIMFLDATNCVASRSDC